MTDLEMDDFKRNIWTDGYLNGALDYGENSRIGIEELIGWVADSAYDAYVEEQEEEAVRNRG